MRENIVAKKHDLFRLSIVGHITPIVNPPRVKPRASLLERPTANQNISSFVQRQGAGKLCSVALNNLTAPARKQPSLMVRALAIHFR
jgi:hypothetical protein